MYFFKTNRKHKKNRIQKKMIFIKREKEMHQYQYAVRGTDKKNYLFFKNKQKHNFKTT